MGIKDLVVSVRERLTLTPLLQPVKQIGEAVSGGRSSIFISSTSKSRFLIMEIVATASSMSSTSSPRPSNRRWQFKESTVSLDNSSMTERWGNNNNRGPTRNIRSLVSGDMRSLGKFSSPKVASSRILMDGTLALVSSGSEASSVGSYGMALENLSISEEMKLPSWGDEYPGRRPQQRRNSSGLSRKQQQQQQARQPRRRSRHMVSESQERWNISLNESLEDYMTAKENTSIVSTDEDPPTPEYDPRCSWSMALPKNSDNFPELKIPRVRVSVTCYDDDDNDHQKQRIRSVSPPTQNFDYDIQDELTYWNTIVTTRIMNYGRMHNMTAEAFMEKGHASLRAKQYREALESFKSARRIWKAKHGDTHLTVAKASDGIGMAYLRSPKTRENLNHARKNLDYAFTIRYHELGPWHVDTVDSYNKIAGVYLHLSQYNAALKAYEQVFLVRKAIFGDDHPSVAVSAHALANVHFHLSEIKESLYYYNVALEIYTQMHLDMNHPTVSRLLRDRKRLDRVLMSESLVRLEAKDQNYDDYDDDDDDYYNY